MNTTSPWQLLAHYLRPRRIQVLLLWLALLATIATQLVNPQIIRRFIDAAEAGSDLTILLGAAGLFLFIALVEQALGLTTTYLSTDVGWRATNELREDAVRHCLGLDRNFHKAHGPGDLIERIDGDINDLRNFFSQLALNLLNNLLLMGGVLVLLWWEDWRIGLAVTLIAGAGLVLVDWLRRAAVPFWQQARQRTAELYGYLEERLHGTEDIRANGAVAYAMHGLYAHIQRAYTAALGTRPYNVGGLMTPILVFGLAYVVIGQGIHDVNLQIKRGTLTVITGRIGSGKTTLLQALLGLLPKDSGEIRWNEEPVADPATFFVPPRSAYTPQTPRLFSETLRSNILLGLPDAECDITSAIERAILEPDVKAMDDGLDTLIGPRGMRLSGGQAQRTAAARMFVRHPELLVFDDLSSALDIETERLLWERLFATEERPTCLIVSHRQAVLKQADHIIVLKEGQIEDEGKWEELLERNLAMRKTVLET